MFFHLLDISVWNAYILCQKNGGQKSNHEFQKSLIERIIEKFHTLTEKVGRPSVQLGPLRLTERHFPKYVPPTKKNKLIDIGIALYVAIKEMKRGRKNGKKPNFL